MIILLLLSLAALIVAWFFGVVLLCVALVWCPAFALFMVPLFYIRVRMCGYGGAFVWSDLKTWKDNQVMASVVFIYTDKSRKTLAGKVFADLRNAYFLTPCD